MKRARIFAVLTVAVTLAMPMMAGAEDEGAMPLTWVGFINVKPGAGPQFEKAFDTYQVPLLNKLVADGKATSWGLGYELAGPGGYDYVMWITMPGWAGMSAVEGAFDERYEGMSEDELTAMLEDWMSAIEPENERTQLLRHLVFKAAPDGKYKYLRLSAYTVKPGHGKDVTKMYKSFVAPVYDQLLESDVIAGYGMLEQAVHADPSFTHEAWITFNDLADLAKVEKAFGEASEAESEGDTIARDLAFMKMGDAKAHYDSLIRVYKQND